MLNALRRLVTYLLLAVIVLTAFTSLMLRLLTPMLGEYRTDIEQWAGELIQQPISIESIDARIDGFTPKLNLVGVELLDNNRQFPIARFGGLSIHFGMLRTLMNGRLTLDQIELHGLDISLVRDVDGSISVSGLGAAIKREDGDSQRQSEKAGKGFAAWMLQQGRVSLYKSHINLIDLKLQQNLYFPDISIVLNNSVNQHRLHGRFELPEELGGELEVDLRLTGDVADRKSWNGGIYLQGDVLNSNTILKWLALKEWQLQNGTVDGELWGDIVAGEVTQLQGRFAANSIGLDYQGRRLPLTQFDTQAKITRVDSDWQLQLSRINFGGALRGKMPHYLQLKAERDGWRVSLDQINLSALPSLIRVIKPDFLDEGAQFRGHLREIDLFYGKRVDAFRARLDQVGGSGISAVPVVTGLSGRVDLSERVVSLAINSPNLKLDIPSLFGQPLPT